MTRKSRSPTAESMRCRRHSLWTANGKVVAATIGLADRDEIEANIKKALGSGEQAEKGAS